MSLSDVVNTMHCNEIMPASGRKDKAKIWFTYVWDGRIICKGNKNKAAEWCGGALTCENRK